LDEVAPDLGDAEEGERIFYHPKGPGCYKCHRVEGRGGRIGPDLTATGPATSREKLIRSIVEPDADIAPQFTTWRVVRQDGTQLDGVLVEEAINGDQTYADAAGKRATIKAADLAERKPLTNSVMPRDLLAKLNPKEFRDLLAFVGRESPAPDNSLTGGQEAAGWKLLFDGKTLNGWTTEKKAASKVNVQDGAINPHGSGGYMLIQEKEWGDFVLSLDFKITPKCNSGVFIRTSPLEPRPGKDIGFNGIEVAIDDTKTADHHDTGAIYDLVKPSHNAMKPVGEWNHMEIICDGPLIFVYVNGEITIFMDLDQWTEKNKRPDGSAHKFDIAYTDHPRKGYIGLQDHGGDCWYKNIMIRELKK
jgi:putative heme-binding domain-containing protein